MRISVKLYAVLQIGRFQEKVLEVVDGSSVGDIVKILDLPPEHVDILLVNGLHVDADRTLCDDDVLSILPMVEGG